MERNPYTPPAAEVSDISPGPVRHRPVYVTIAVVIYFIGLASDILRWIPRFGDMQRGEASMLALIAPVVGFAALTWLYLRVYAGRNWARIAVLLLFILSLGRIVLGFASLPEEVRWSLDWRGLVRPAFNALALVLLFGPGRAWFAPR